MVTHMWFESGLAADFFNLQVWQLVTLRPFNLQKPTAGPWLVRVRWVQLHPSILGKGCMHPSIFWPDTSFRFFCLIFPLDGQTLHPSIKISNQGTATVPLWKDIDPVIKLFSAQEFGSILDVHFVLTKRSYLQRVYLVSKWFNNFLSECTWSLNFFYWIKKHPNLLISEYNTFASSFKSFNFSRHYLF